MFTWCRMKSSLWQQNTGRSRHLRKDDFEEWVKFVWRWCFGMGGVEVLWSKGSELAESMWNVTVFTFQLYWEGCASEVHFAKHLTIFIFENLNIWTLEHLNIWTFEHLSLWLHFIFVIFFSTKLNSIAHRILHFPKIAWFDS